MPCAVCDLKNYPSFCTLVQQLFSKLLRDLQHFLWRQLWFFVPSGTAECIENERVLVPRQYKRGRCLPFLRKLPSGVFQFGMHLRHERKMAWKWPCSTLRPQKKLPRSWWTFGTKVNNLWLVIWNWNLIILVGYVAWEKRLENAKRPDEAGPMAPSTAHLANGVDINAMGTKRKGFRKMTTENVYQNVYQNVSQCMKNLKMNDLSMIMLHQYLIHVAPVNRNSCPACISHAFRTLWVPQVLMRSQDMNQKRLVFVCCLLMVVVYFCSPFLFSNPKKVPKKESNRPNLTSTSDLPCRYAPCAMAVPGDTHRVALTFLEPSQPGTETNHQAIVGCGP